MANTPGQVTKIYKLSTLGFDTVHKEFQTLSDDLLKIKKAKLSAQGKLLAATDSTEVKKLTEEIAKLVLEEQKLKVENQKLLNELKALNIQRQEEQRQQKAKIQGNIAEEGSIAKIRLAIKELNAQLILKNQKGTGTISFQGEILSIDQATAKLKQLIATEQEFRRAFSRDATLVGEYTSGIVQAFKQMGLDDLVGGQITRTKDRLNSLNTDFDRLQKELQETRAAGQATETIEKQMIENRNEVIKLDTELARLKTDLRGTGDIGNQITTAIGNGFKSLKGQLFGFALGFVGIQAIFNKVVNFASGFKAEFEEAETSVARFNAALANAGRETEFNDLNKSVDELAAKFQFLDNDAIRNATEKLIVYGKVGKEQIQTLLPIIIDFATRQRISIEEATDAIIKGLEGNAKAFKTYGINLKEGGNESERFGIIVNDLGKKIAGTAESFKNLNSGELAKNQQQWKDLQEEIGTKVVPILITLGTIILNVVSVLLRIPFPLLIAGITGVTAALALYKAEQIRSYLVTQIATKQGLIYNAYLIAQRVAQLAVAAATRIATAEIVLFNGAIRVSPIGILLTALGLIIPAIALFANRLKEAKREVNALNEVNIASRKIYSDQIAKINSWVDVIKSASTSADTKKRAVEELTKINSRFGAVVKDNVIDLKELEKAYGEVTNAIILQARAQASAELTAKKQQKQVNLQVLRQEIEIATARGSDFFLNTKTTDLPDDIIELLKNLKGVEVVRNLDLSFNIAVTNKNVQKALQDLTSKELDATKEFQEFLKVKGKADADLEAFIKSQQGEVSVFEVDIKKLRDQIAQLDEDINKFQGSEADLAAKIKERDAAQKQLDKLLNKKEPTTKTKDSRLTAEQKDAFKDIDALRDKEIADETIRFKERQINEERFLKNILQINQNAIDDKLKLLKGSNAEERKQIAELNLEKITQEQETNKKIFELLTKALKDQLEVEIANIKLRAAAVQNDPTLSATDKAQAKLDADNQILNLQLEFNARIDFLEKQLAQNSLTNAEESAEDIRKTKEQILQDELDLSEARLKDIETDGKNERAKIETNFAKLRQAIINNDKLTAKRREEALKKLDAKEKFTILSSEVKQLSKEFKEITDLYNAGLKSTEEFLNKKAELEKKKTERDQAKKTLQVEDIDLPSEQTTQKIFQDRLSKLFDFAEGGAEDQLLGQVISESFSLATDAMNSYFDAEENRIRQNLEVQLERLEMEQQQVTARAQSQEEIAGIEKEFAAKKRRAEQQAGEELKKAKRAEAKIALATELANIAASAAANPANAVTFGAAGVIMYGILAGLALARYALRVGEINSQKFEFGGKPGEVPVRGGEFGGKSHSKGGTDFSFKGRKYNAEVKELAVIRTKNAPANKKFRVEGTQMEIASAINRIGGGIDFRPGASIKKFASGGLPGGVLQPPVLTNSSNVINNFGGVSEEKFDQLIDKIEEMNDATNGRIDRLEVVQVTSSVTNAQKKETRQSSIGTL